MRFVLIPFAICLLLYIRQENQYRFRAATALKILLTMTLTVCLTVALVRNFSPVLLLAAVGMLLCAGGDFFLQYIRLDAAKFTKGILLFGLGQMCNITALSLLAPFHWCAAALLAEAVKKKTPVCYEDLGPEAICRLEVENFYAIVGIDSRGNTIIR